MSPPRQLAALPAALAVALAALALIGAAADPADRLPDPAQEAHARLLFAQTRCVVCQNQSIDDSEAPLAHDLRQSIRAQVAQGHSDAEIRHFLVARYGEFILMRPRFSLGNSPLWLAPLALLVAAGGLMLARTRSAGPVRPEPELTAQERARLHDLGADQG